MSGILLNEREILMALSAIKDPDLGKDIVSLGFIRNLRIEGGSVSFDINLTTPACPVKDQMKEDAQRAVVSLAGVKEVRVEMTSEVKQHPGLDKSALSGVRNIVAVGSGKGGVGKSTVATNIAAGLAQAGAAVGLLDADIYGPSIPIMMGSRESPGNFGNRIAPLERHGIKFLSMGLFVPGDKPLIWRGPMAHKALQQTLFETEWGNLDYLVVDLPPGTGDVHLTLVQSVPVTGAVIVSTPQDVGLQISMKTLRMLQQTGVPILGLVENMSYHTCTHCGHREDLFGHGATRSAAGQLGLPFLGEIPIDIRIREQADAGTPIVLAEPDSASAKAYTVILENLAAQISIQNYSSSPLQIEEVPA